MKIVTIDFETYYDKEYSLSKITTEEYVRSPLFEVIGVGVRDGDGKSYWFTGTMEETQQFLNKFCKDDVAILCHNTFFDGLILSHHFGVKPKFWFDTLSMARPTHGVTAGGSLHKLTQHFKLGTKGTEVVQAMGKRRADFAPEELSQYGSYCLNDVALTWALFGRLRVDFPVGELMLIDRTIRMYTEPRVVLDRQVLETHLKEVKDAQEQLLTACGGKGLSPEEVRKTLNSDPRFAALLRACGVEPPMKTSPTTGKETYAFAKTDVAFKKLEEHPDPRVQTIVAARLGTKSTIEETRTQRLIEVSERGPLPIMLNYYGAHTGRYSGGDKLNLQNLPSRKNNAIRRAVCAPDGYKLLACDASQIEARITGYVAKQADLVQAFANGEDVYSLFAGDLYGYPVDKSKPTERFLGKTCILGLGYGMGPPKFKDTLESGVAGMVMQMEEAEAKRIVYFYRGRYPMIKSLWDECNNVLATMIAGGSGIIRGLLQYDATGIHLPNGMKIVFHGLCERDGDYYYINNQRDWRKFQADPNDKSIKWTKIYGGKVVENIVQALARIVVFDQLVQISHHYPVLFQVHDENVMLVPDAEVSHAQQHVEQIMSTPPQWAPDLPVACESAVGQNFGECK